MLALFTLSREGSLEGFCSHRIFSRLCRCGTSDPLFASVRRPRAESDSRLLSSFGILQTFQHSNFRTFLRSISFRITSFADSHHLTPIESHLCKKQGRGWGIHSLNPTQPPPLFSTATQHVAHSSPSNSNRFKCLLRGSLDNRVGILIVSQTPDDRSFRPCRRGSLRSSLSLLRYITTSLLLSFPFSITIPALHSVAPKFTGGANSSMRDR
jgi:hypothetical protein